MKTFNKYGIYAVVGWLLFITLLLVIGSQIAHITFGEYYLSGTDSIGFTLFIAITSAVWYLIGYFQRKQYLDKRAAYQKMYPELDNELLCEMFQKHYIAKNAKLLYPVFLISVPAYMLFREEDPFATFDYVLILVLTIVAITLYSIYRKNNQVTF